MGFVPGRNVYNNTMKVYWALIIFIIISFLFSLCSIYGQENDSTICKLPSPGNPPPDELIYEYVPETYEEKKQDLFLADSVRIKVLTDKELLQNDIYVIQFLMIILATVLWTETSKL